LNIPAKINLAYKKAATDILTKLNKDWPGRHAIPVNSARRTPLLIFFVFSVFILSGKLHAQQFSKVEIGVQGTSVSFSDRVDDNATQGGIGFRTTYNFSSLFSLDAEADFLLNQASTGLQRGGRPFILLAGPRASWRRKKLTLFANARTGFASFSGAPHISSGLLPDGTVFVNESPGRTTHLVLDLGAGVEVNTSSRTFLRFDAGQMLLRYGDQLHHIPEDSFGEFIQGEIGGGQRFGVGFGYRLGRLKHEVLTDKEAGKKILPWEIGFQYGVLILTRSSLVDSPNLVPNYDPFAIGDDPGVGGRVAYNLKRWLALESAVTYFYRQPTAGDAQRGGKMLEGVFGPRMGVRSRKIGMFAKLQPGFLSYGGVHDSFFAPLPTQRLTHFAVDAGGVLEYYPSKRTIMRFDLDALGVWYGAVKVVSPPSLFGDFVRRGFQDAGMQFTAGFGWRF
jgi:hypothetical protein